MTEQIASDRLRRMKREELERTFPGVLHDVKVLCSGDAVALLSKTFEDRACEWRKIADLYDNNPYLGDFFSKTIHELHDAKAKAYVFEKGHKDLIKNFRQLFSAVSDGVVIDLLVALLIYWSFKTPTELYPGSNIHRKAAEMIEKLKRTDDLGEVVEPEDFTLEYVVRAVLLRKLAISSD